VHSAEPSPDHTLLTLSGDLDVATAGQFGDRLAEALAGGCRQLDVDLAAVGFCDVVAFNLLLAAGRTMRGRRGTLRILDACWSVERMAALFEVHDLLTLAPTETVTEAPGAGVGG
jgi:anti-sigma B factor antagonist